MTERAIADARDKGVTSFDDVLLVGGMARMPAVARALKERLGLTARLHEPDFAVGEGRRAVRPHPDDQARGGTRRPGCGQRRTSRPARG